MCMDVSHNSNRANPQVISFDYDKDLGFFNKSLCSVMSYSYDHLHIKQILISQERSNIIWKSCK